MATSLSPGKTCVGILFESTTSDLQMTTISGYPMIELFLGWMRMKLLCPINPLKKKINHVLDFYMIFWETIRNSKRVILIFDTPQFIKIILSGLWRLFPIFCSNVVIVQLCWTLYVRASQPSGVLATGQREARHMASGRQFQIFSSQTN